MELEWKESAEQHEFHPRGTVDAPSEDALLHWMRRQVRVLHGGTNAQKGWWLRVKAQMLERDRDVVTVR